MPYRAGAKTGGRRPLPVAGSYSSALPGAPHWYRRPPAPARSAATSPCASSVQWPCCRSPSTSQSPDRIVPRLLRRQAIAGAAGHQHLPVRQQRRCVRVRAVAMLPVAVHIPVAGSYSSALAKYASRRSRRPPAPAHSAATSPCASCVQWPCCRSPSTPQSPDRIVPRLLSSRCR